MEIVVVLMVLMIAAVIVIALMSGQTSLFEGFSDNQTSNAQCQLWETNYERNFCQNGQDTGGGTDLDSKLDQCDNVQISCRT